jgi:hypothetical protein
MAGQGCWLAGAGSVVVVHTHIYFYAWKAVGAQCKASVSIVTVLIRARKPKCTHSTHTLQYLALCTSLRGPHCSTEAKFCFQPPQKKYSSGCQLTMGSPQKSIIASVASGSHQQDDPIFFLLLHNIFY